MSKRRQHHEEEAHENAERWLLTYADMITLLMVLFIVLFAISTVDQKKFNAFGMGLAKAFGSRISPIEGSAGVLHGGSQAIGQQIITGGSGRVTLPSLPQLRPRFLVVTNGNTATSTNRSGGASANDKLEQARKEIVAALAARHLQADVQFTLQQRGLVVTVLTDDVLFPLGEATLQPQGNRILDALAPALRRLSNSVSVEGHTDDLRITGGPYPTNWELSAMRATAVLRYLVEHGGVPADRISATGYGAEHPIVANDSAADRARNRRVDIVILSAASMQQLSSQAATASGTTSP